jgi:hypothetical protein
LVRGGTGGGKFKFLEGAAELELVGADLMVSLEFKLLTLAASGTLHPKIK